MKRMTFIIAFMAAMFCSCEKIDEFTVRKNDGTDVFNDVKYSKMPDGLWTRVKHCPYKLDKSGKVVEEGAFESDFFPGTVTPYYVWENNEITTCYSLYVFDSDDIEDVVISSQPKYDEFFNVDKKTRKGICPPYAGDEDILVTSAPAGEKISENLSVISQ